MTPEPEEGREYFLDLDNNLVHLREDCSLYDDAVVTAKGIPLEGFEWCDKCTLVLDSQSRKEIA